MKAKIIIQLMKRLKSKVYSDKNICKYLPMITNLNVAKYYDVHDHQGLINSMQSSTNIEYMCDGGDKILPKKKLHEEGHILISKKKFNCEQEAILKKEDFFFFASSCIAITKQKKLTSSLIPSFITTTNKLKNKVFFSPLCIATTIYF